MSPPVGFEELVRTHTPNLRRFCTRLAGSSDGDDLMQETLTRAMASFESLRDHERFLPWCRQIARNAHARHVQRERPTEPLVDSSLPGDLATDLVDDLVRRAEVAHILAELPPRSRHVLTARAEGISPASLATELGVSRTLVDTWFARSRAQARHLLHELRQAGLSGTAALPVAGLLRKHPLRRAATLAGAGAGVTLLLLVAPQSTIAAPPPARAVRLPAASTSAATSMPARTPRAVTRSVHPVVATGAREPELAPAGSRPGGNRPLGLPRPQPLGRVIAAAERQPIVVGPFLPDGELVVGADPCGLIHTLEPACPGVLAGLHLHVP